MVKNKRIKIFAIVSLGVLAIAMFYFYISGKKSTSSEYQNEKQPVQIPREQISKDIDSIIYTFGISKEWIRESPVKDAKNKTPSQLISRVVLIPNDLSLIDLNYEITNYLRNNSFDNKVIEDPRTKNISMEIFAVHDTGRKTIGNIKFEYSDSIVRNPAEVCVILDSVDSYNLNDVENTLKSTQEFSVILPLRNDKADYQSKITELKRDYLLKFMIGDQDDVDADFKEDMKEAVWKAKVKAATLSFPQTSGVVLSNKKNLRDFESKISEEFRKNNFTVYDDSMFYQLKNDRDRISFLFGDIISRSGTHKKNLFYVLNFTPEEFSKYDSQVYILKKLGYKFFNFRDMIKRINKTNNKPEAGNDTK